MSAYYMEQYMDIYCSGLTCHDKKSIFYGLIKSSQNMDQSVVNVYLYEPFKVVTTDDF